MISISKIWAETRTLARQEWALLFPLSLATCGLATMFNFLSVGNSVAAQTEPTVMIFAGLLVAILLTLVGQLSIAALALGDRRSVNEALRLAVARLPSVALLLLALFFVLLCVVFLGTILAQLSGADLLATPPRLGAVTAFLILLVIALGVWLAGRTLTLYPVLMESDVAVSQVFSVFGRAFRSTKPVGQKLFGIVAATMLLYSSLSNLLINVAGRALMLVAKTVGMDGLVAVILAVLLGILAAVVSIYFGVFQVKLYHHLQAETPR
ncbi:MAG: hypothetical protein RIS52_1894 [Pseudomonadota bacterium]|jgi:hypothetical protein